MLVLGVVAPALRCWRFAIDVLLRGAIVLMSDLSQWLACGRYDLTLQRDAEVLADGCEVIGYFLVATF